MPLRTGLFVALLAAAPLVAQAQSKEQMIADWTRDKTNVLDYTRAIPDSALGFRPTPGVRTLAEQIEHIVQTNEQVAAEALRGAANPKLGDPKVYLKNKAALVKYVTDTYDYAIAALRAATPAMLAKPVSVFKLPAQPAERWMALSHEHTSWTLGQTIPYLRLNGVKPPDYQIPF